jgi:hypothetical protein
VGYKGAEEMIANIAAPYPTDPLAIAGLWIALFLMLAIYSYPLWKENPVFRIVEHYFVALSMAIGLIVNLTSLNSKDARVYLEATGTIKPFVFFD